MTERITLLTLLLAPVPVVSAQHPLRHPVDAVEMRFARAQPVVAYTLRVDAADLTGFDVEMRIRNSPDSVRLAMPAHPEYHDRYWRFVEGLRVEARAAGATVAREEDGLWRAVIPGGEGVVRYRIRLPEPEVPRRASWRPFLAPTGGLVGGPHAFMYLVGAELAPSRVTVEVPAGWSIATGLTPTSEPRTFFAPGADVLVDSPMLVGRYRSWRFAIDHVPHHVVYWPLPSEPTAQGVQAAVRSDFDSAALVHSIEQLTRQAVALFGRAPYREYHFLIQDGAYGGLEHLNSVTIGAPSSDLASNPAAHLGEIAHEFIHTWNLMRIRPAERGGVHHRQGGRSRGLWWSEGATMYYADVLLRRAALPTSDSTRTAHLEGLIARYLFNPGNVRISPERASLFEYGVPPGSLGDYDPSVHVQGELLATLLDLLIRDATGGRRSLDDVMRAMLERFAGERGFTGRDVERTVASVCACDVRPFFDAHVRGARAVDVDRYLRLAGMRAHVTRTPALDRAGRPAPDLRIRAWLPEGERALRLLLTDPTSAWGRAGLHTGDRLASVNGTRVSTWPELRAVLGRLRLGDSALVEVDRPGGPWRTRVVVSGYDQPTVRIEPITDATERQRVLRARWLAAVP